MKQLVINGGNDLSGIVNVSGSKNSLLAIIAASIITKSIIELSNVPPLNDTYDMIAILKKLNVRVLYDNRDKLIIDARNIKNVILDDIEVKRIRASYYFMGALLSLYKKVNIVMPGGCKFASRPIDLHLFAFEKLGCEYVYKDGIYKFNKTKIKNRVIKFKKVSVGATVNAILASTHVSGKITLVNVAKEPEIDDLICFINKCGGEIKRDGNSIIINGKKNYHECKYRIMDDRIEAGTFLILGACLGKKLKIVYKDYYHLESLIKILKDIGIDIVLKDGYMLVNKCYEIKDSNVVFDVYPHIATDLQQPLSILMSKSCKRSILKDKIYPSRYTQIEDLKKMGFDMVIDGKELIVYRSDNIIGSEVSCKDLRGGISLVLAACLANGKTWINNMELVNRGYYNLVNKLKNIGVRIYEKD